MSWDGSGHFAILQVYDREIFPDVFGWTRNYFGGMGFPNSYPPLWFWSISALHHTGLPLELTAKILILLSMASIPLTVGMLARVTTRSQSAAYIAVLLCSFPLLDRRMMPQISGGLTFYGTFTEGIYTEPLGFVFFVLFLISVLRPVRSRLAASASSGLLLSLVLLSNFFACVSCLPFLASDGLLSASRERHSARLMKWFAALLLAAGLTAFWTFPVLRNYQYFVTSPVHPPLSEVVPVSMWIWFEVGVICSIWCFRVSGRPMRVFLIGILLLASVAACAGIPMTRSLPLQLPRFVAILALLITIPIAQAVSSLTVAFVDTVLPPALIGLGKRSLVVMSLIFVCLFLTPARLDTSLYTSERASQELETVLTFGQLHPDGRYLIVMPHAHKDRYLARAISSYLGAQGNEIASTVFREASPSALFFLPLQNTFSGTPVSFGISSNLAQDDDFLNEPWPMKLKQARELGVRYIVSPDSSAPLDLPAYPLDRWTVYEIGLPPPSTEALLYLPALFVGNASFKDRKGANLEFVGLTEEQFRSADYTVRLALGTSGIFDKQPDLSRFGAMILKGCAFGGERQVFDLVRSFVRDRLIVVLDDGSTACKRLSSSFPGLLKVIPMPVAGQSSIGTNRVQNSRLTPIWNQLNDLLKENRVPAVGAASGDRDPSGSRGDIPYLIRETYSPDWHTQDGAPIYLCGPTSMITFSGGSPSLTFQRRRFEQMGPWLSALTALALMTMTLRSYRSRPQRG
jgi:hypothetical protein